MATALARKRGAVELIAVRAAMSLPIHILRVTTLRLLGARVASTACLYHGAQVRAPRRLVIGERSIVGENAVLDARGGLVLGNDVNFSSEVHIWTAQHDWRDPEFRYMESAVTVGDRAWLGPRVTVLPGSRIGAGAVVAAGAVVHGEILPGTLVGGVPARPISDEMRQPRYRLSGRKGKTWWW